MVTKKYNGGLHVIGLILVSHSKKITDGVKEMIDEMVGTSEIVEIKSCGGADDGRLGTNSLEILDCLESYSEANQILIFSDIGSAILSAETAIDLIDSEELKSKIRLVDAPLVEGAFAAAVKASVTSSLDEILLEVANC